MYEFQVRDGNRVLQFDGELLAESSSQRRGEWRWVEFKLYRTKSGSYVLSRIGQTRLFHHPSCDIVERNKIKVSPPDMLIDEHVPCSLCNPYDDEDVAIEKPRFFALSSEKPEAIIEALYKEDKSGARYLTIVAQKLIEQAGEKDARIYNAYMVETID